MKYYYHGSSIPGITQLEARSRLHQAEEKVVYLTDHIPYALYYIWDAARNGGTGKHVTGWVKNDIAYYEEQFPDQLQTFYQGVSGYLYCIAESPDIKAVENRPHMFYCTADAPVAKAIPIANVYEELLKYEAEGQFVALRYLQQSPERQSELIDLIAKAILRDGFYAEDAQQRAFMKKYFSQAWQKAEQMK